MKTKSFRFILFLFAYSMLGASFANADTLPGNTTPPQTATQTPPVNTTIPTAPAAPTSPTTPITPLLIQKITEGKQLLANVDLHYALNPHYKTVTKTTGTGKKKKTTKSQTLSNYTLDNRDLALAIYDPTTNNVAVALGIQNGRSVTFNDPNFSIRQIGFNGVNTRFQVTKPAGGIVVGLKYLITPTESGSKDAIVSSLSNAIYTPYSPELNQPDVAQFGGQYIDNMISQVSSQLQNLPSQSVPRQTITQAIKPSIVKALVYAEHMDASEVLYGADVQAGISKVNTLFAGNQGDTYKYSVSSGSARGIAQFISGTYHSLVARHPDANLNPDFIAGMNDHVNAIKAEYLLLDDYAAAVRNNASNYFNPAYVYDYAAAAYNGGTTRVIKALAAYGSSWASGHADSLNQIQSQIDSENGTISSLKAQIKKAAKNTKLKAQLSSQLATENAKLGALQDQYNSENAGTLRNETLSYLDKMHALIQVFNQ